MSLPIDPDEAVVVVGGMATKATDRSLARHDIHPAQIFTADGVEMVPALDWGGYGVSAMVVRAEAGVVYCSSRESLFLLDLADGTIVNLGIDLHDSHEITEIDGVLWIANTGSDEAIAFDVATAKIVRRVRVRSSRSSEPAPQSASLGPDAASTDGGETVDKFHGNQIVRALDGKLWVLVHHVDGKQIVKYVAQRLVKMQGNGGVIELETGLAVALGLSGPHSIQEVGDNEQWICDSRAGLLRVYDRDWREYAQIPCAGWGRGISVSTATGRAYVGISAIRKRYLQIIPSSQHSDNMLQVFDIAGRTLLGETVVHNLETINNVYVVSRATAEQLLRVPAGPGRPGRHGEAPPRD